MAQETTYTLGDFNFIEQETHKDIRGVVSITGEGLIVHHCLSNSEAISALRKLADVIEQEDRRKMLGEDFIGI